MSSLNKALTSRLEKKEKKSDKMAHLAKRSQEGTLNTFSGVFQIGELSSQEKEQIEQILYTFCNEEKQVPKDLNELLFITSEVKAITHQAVLLHGERIQKAQALLQSYQEGAFTSWLIATYGNRQTPYNFLRYFEFWHLLSSNQQKQVELMPRQAVYSLASREGDLQKKFTVVENFSGETKAQLLHMIRELFPLAEKDKRKASFAEGFTQALEKLLEQTEQKRGRFTNKQKDKALALLAKLQENILSW